MGPAEPAAEINVREWKRDLARYSTIQATSGDSFSIHSLVQLVERHQVPAVEQGGIIQRAVALMMAWAPVPAYEYQNWERWRILDPHARHLAQEQSRHPSVSPDPVFLNAYGGYLASQGAYREAEPLYRRSLAIQEKALGPGHPDVAESLNNMGRALSQSGQVCRGRAAVPTLTGGGLKYEPKVSGYLYKLQRWESPTDRQGSNDFNKSMDTTSPGRSRKQPEVETSVRP
jgi:hypothetical protein